jgi:glycosyltransferase involved in cell wall biosynthesis
MATHNGAGTLARVLSAYSRLARPPGGWRLVVVDNLSSDDTAQVLERFATELPLLVVNCARRGKNVALNCGLDHVEGDLVVFTDDDTVPDEEWLVLLRQAADQHSECDVFGGRIFALWPDDLPEWIPQLVNLGATYGETPRECAEGPVSPTRVWGANMAVRASVFAAGHRFNELVGPGEGQYMMGSEVEFTGRIEKQGHRAWFVDKARVGHIIRPHQIERDWIIQRGYRLGRHMYHQEVAIFPVGTKLIRGAPRWKYRQFATALGRSAAGALTGNFALRFAADWELSFLRGYFAEAGRCARSSSR